MTCSGIKGTWIKPNRKLDNTYLQGSLIDKAHDCRQMCLRYSINLLEHLLFIASVIAFTGRFEK